MERRRYIRDLGSEIGQKLFERDFGPYTPPSATTPAPAPAPVQPQESPAPLNSGLDQERSATQGQGSVLSDYVGTYKGNSLFSYSPLSPEQGNLHGESMLFPAGIPLFDSARFAAAPVGPVSHHTEFNFSGPINVHTQATDADGIVKDMNRALAANCRGMVEASTSGVKLP